MFYYFDFSPLLNFPFLLLSFSFPLLYQISALILYIASLISRIFRISIKISDQDFKKIVTLVQKRTLPFVTTA